MFKFSGKLARKAHELTREIKKEYPEVNYSFQFGLEMKCLLSQKEEENKVVELKGSKKQVAWAEKIRDEKMEDWKKEQENLKDAENKKYVAELTAAAERIFTVENASNWIDMRNASIVRLARMDMKKQLMLVAHYIADEKAFADRYEQF